MIVYKYSKVHPSSLAGHMDTVRTFMRMMRRAKIDVRYSLGFNPHMLVFASPALPVGVDSNCEYMAVDMDMQDDIIGRLNAVAPSGMCVDKMWQVDAVNLSAIITSAMYHIHLPTIGQYCQQLSSQPYSIDFVLKGQLTTKEVSMQIHGVQCIDNDNISITLDCGNSTLRADRIVGHIMRQHNIDSDYNIVKQCMYVGDVDMDKYLDNLVTAS